MKFLLLFILIGLTKHSLSQLNLFCETRQITLAERRSSSAGLSDSYLLWDNGKTIKVKFLNGSKNTIDRIMKIGKEWEQYANVKFHLVESGETAIRILLTHKKPLVTQVGVTAYLIPLDEPTTEIDTSEIKSEAALRQLVLHTFGHLLGLQHENISTDKQRWNFTALDQLARKNDWRKDELEKFIIEPYSVSFSNSLIPDLKSVMYASMNELKSGKVPTTMNSELSVGDKQLVSLLYPFNKTKVPLAPSFKIDSFYTIRITGSETGFCFYPKLKITVKDAVKLQFGIFLYTEDGELILNEESSYSYDGVLASMKGFSHIPDKTYAVNAKANDLGLFVPYNRIPEHLKGKRIAAVFKVFYPEMYLSEEYSTFTSKPVFFTASPL